MTDALIVLSTCGSGEEAARIARTLVEERTAACVNIVPGIRSIYRWQGAIEEAGEWLLIIKTRRALLDALKTRLAAVHSYETPELLALPVEDGAAGYLAWLTSELAAG
jgi:periplasmic divalent cation tolerance protein